MTDPVFTDSGAYAQDPDATTPSSGTSTTEAAKSAAADTAGTAVEQGKAVAGHATDQAKDVAAGAKEQLGAVTTQAKDQAQRVMSTATSEIGTQAEQRLGTATSAARDTAGQLRALLDGRTDEAGRMKDLAEQAHQRLDYYADRADELGVQGVVEEISDFARRRPVAFLAGAATAGFLAGRLARAGKEVQSSGGSSGSSSELYGSSTPALSSPTTPVLTPSTISPASLGAPGGVAQPEPELGTGPALGGYDDAGRPASTGTGGTGGTF